MLTDRVLAATAGPMLTPLTMQITRMASYLRSLQFFVGLEISQGSTYSPAMPLPSSSALLSRLGVDRTRAEVTPFQAPDDTTPYRSTSRSSTAATSEAHQTPLVSLFSCSPRPS